MKFGADLVVPKTPGPLLKTATLETRDLYITQAVELCRRVLRDKSRPAGGSCGSSRLSWLLHLVADCHHPCHAGSLYMVVVFPQGDQWAHSIPTKQGGNLHRFWDGLLGSTFDPTDVRRRVVEIQTNESLWIHANDVATGLSGLDPATWLAESKEHGKDDVYSAEVMSAVEEAMSKSVKVVTLTLSEAYVKNAGAVARKRAAFAAHRLALILREGF